MSPNGRGTWYVRPMPSRHRAAAFSRVTVRPANRTSPAPGARSPEMRPNRLVLPAPFGPTMPTVSPAPTARDRSSAMTTRPNRFVTLSSSSSGLVIWSLVGRLQVGGDLGVRLQRVVHDLGLNRELGALLPLDADRRGDRHTRRGTAGGEVKRPGHRLREVHLVDGGGDFLLVVRVAHRGEGRVGGLKKAVVADVGVPLPIRGCLEIAGQLLAGLPGERGRPRQRRRPPGVGGDVVSQVPKRVSVRREQQHLGYRGQLRPEALLDGLL